MYRPTAFDETDADTIRALVRAAPFATLLTVDEHGVPDADHLPVLDDERAPGLRLFGHMARANPQWRRLAAGAPARLIFHGPHTYITPSWYSESFIPTWSYAVVHARGPVRLIEDFAALDELVRRTMERFEAAEPTPASYALPEELRRQKFKAIVGFTMDVETVEAKLKISQNRSEADRRGAMRGLAGRTDEMSAGILELMKKRYGDF